LQCITKQIDRNSGDNKTHFEVCNKFITQCKNEFL